MSRYARQAKRLHPTNCARWRAIRAQVLAREPLCRMCKAKGRITAASHVDHVNGRADRPEDYEAHNLQPLCASCHSIKTAAEDGSFGRKGTYIAPGCDADGIPTDRRHPWHQQTS